ELERQRRELDLRAMREARMSVARGILRRLTSVPVRALARTHDYMVLRVRRIVWLGGDAYFDFELPNRGRTSYEIGTIEIMMSGENQAADVALSPDVVSPGMSERGVVCLPRAARFVDKRVTLVVNEVDQPARVIRADLHVRQ